jgi:hypothetical protein
LVHRQGPSGNCARRVRRRPGGHEFLAVLAVASILVGIVLADGPENLQPALRPASAPPSPYNLSYSQTPSTANPNIGLTRVVTNYTSGPNLTCSFSVAGMVNLTSNQYDYLVYFEGNNLVNATAYVAFQNNTTFGRFTSFTTIPYPTLGVTKAVLSSGGSALSFSMATTLLGPAANFSVNAEAIYTSPNGLRPETSWLGSQYPSATASPSGSGVPLWLDIALIVLVVAAVVAVVAVVLVRRSRRPPANTAEFQ